MYGKSVFLAYITHGERRACQNFWQAEHVGHVKIFCHIGNAGHIWQAKYFGAQAT